MPKYKFVINPVPLKRKHKIFLEELKDKMLKGRICFSYEYTAKQKNAEALSKKAVSEGYEIIVACGGDGTVLEVVNGIYGTTAKLAILPLGTSNDFAKHLGLSDLGKATEALFKGRKKDIDLGIVALYVKERLKKRQKKLLFCSTSGIGFDARLLKLNDCKWFIKMKKLLGNIVYPLFGLLMLFSYKSPEAEIKLKNRKIKIKLFMLNANFVKSMSGMKITPNADVNNGVFDIFIAEDSSIFKKLAGFLWYSFTSKKINFNEVDYISKNGLGDNKYNLRGIKSFSIASKNPIEVQLNGDIVGVTPAKFKIIPKGMQMLI